MKRAIILTVLVPALAIAQPVRQKKIEEMTPAEVEAISNDLIATCKRAGIHTGSRDFDDCLKREAEKRGLI